MLKCNLMKKWNKKPELKPEISVVVAAYNKPREFEMCLEGYKKQSALIQDQRCFELILADDGSGPEIEQLFKQFSQEFPFPTTYLYQPDQGWGKLRMLNWSILESKSEKIVFTDGDCVPHKHFVRAHLLSCKKNEVACGRRVDLMEKISKRLTAADIKKGKLDSYLLLLQGIFKKEIEFGEKGFYFPSWVSKLLSPFLKNEEPTILGSNFSIYKNWLFQLNGFDESFETPGLGEDTDLERRIKSSGLTLKWITHHAIQFHLWHPLTEVGEKSHKTFETLKQKGNLKALKGIEELQKIIPG